MVILPLYSESFYSYSLDIEEDIYEFTFRYSDRANAFLMDIANAQGDYVIRSVKLVTYTPLLRQYALENFTGDFLLIPRKESPIYEVEPMNPRKIYQSHILVYSSPEDTPEE